MISEWLRVACLGEGNNGGKGLGMERKRNIGGNNVATINFTREKVLLCVSMKQNYATFSKYIYICQFKHLIYRIKILPGNFITLFYNSLRYFLFFS